MIEKEKILILLFIIIGTNIFAQKYEIEQIIQSARKGEVFNGNIENIYKSENETKVLKLLKPYCTDVTQQVRIQSINIIATVGKKSKNIDTRIQAVDILSQACLSKDKLTIFNSVSQLKYFKKEDFSEQAKKTISNIIQNTPPYYNDFVLLAGFLQLNNLKDFFKKQILNEKLKFSTMWKIDIALARMNDYDAIATAIALIKLNNSKIDDNFIYDIVPDLIYTRSKVIYSQILIEILNSNEKNCMPANPNSTEKILCAYRVMEYLAPVIENYPYKLSVSGDLETENYDKALENIRNWFANNPQYKIKKIDY